MDGCIRFRSHTRPSAETRDGGMNRCMEVRNLGDVGWDVELYNDDAGVGFLWDWDVP